MEDSRIGTRIPKIKIPAKVCPEDRQGDRLLLQGNTVGTKRTSTNSSTGWAWKSSPPSASEAQKAAETADEGSDLYFDWERTNIYKLERGEGECMVLGERVGSLPGRQGCRLRRSENAIGKWPGLLSVMVGRHTPAPGPPGNFYLEDDPHVQKLVRDVCDGSLDVVVLLTGVGTRALIGAADSMGVKDDFLTALNRLTVFARSPKPGASPTPETKIHIDVMPPEPYTSADLLESIKEYDLQGRDLAVQAYGSPNGFLTQGLEDRGANVREVTLYTWGLPNDTSPVIRMIDDLGKRGRGCPGVHQPATGTESPHNRRPGQQRAAVSGESLRCFPVAVCFPWGPVCSRRTTGDGACEWMLSRSMFTWAI